MRDKAEAHQNEVKPRQEGNKGGGPQESSQAAAASPPSASSSPTHEFSFTISLHHPVPPATTAAADKATAKHPPPSIAVDLSPADEIFFHGHLLPLHLLSHLPVSPRSSTNSLDSFTLPIKDLLENDSSVPFTPNSFSNSAVAHNNSSSANIDTNERPRPKPKSKSFSLFGRWRKGVEMREKEERERAKRSKQRFDMSHVLKRYMRMVRPLLSSLRGKRDNLSFSRQPYSFSGILTPRGRQELRGRRGEFSAPASMRTSPTNSGLLVATPTSASDSTMEELQAAIQAAIAHCKNSIAKEEKVSKNSTVKEEKVKC